jgi:hypothetical protein
MDSVWSAGDLAGLPGVRFLGKDDGRLNQLRCILHNNPPITLAFQQ